MVTSKSFRMMIRLDGREHEKDLTHWREVNQVFLQVGRAEDWTKSVEEKVEGGSFYFSYGGIGRWGGGAWVGGVF